MIFHTYSLGKIFHRRLIFSFTGIGITEVRKNWKANLLFSLGLHLQIWKVNWQATSGKKDFQFQSIFYLFLYLAKKIAEMVLIGQTFYPFLFNRFLKGTGVKQKTKSWKTKVFAEQSLWEKISVSTNFCKNHSNVWISVWNSPRTVDIPNLCIWRKNKWKIIFMSKSL